MLDRSAYSTWSYVQPGNQCVLAAYAAALWPWTNQPASAYFADYCVHFGLPTPSGAENAYESDFHARAASTPGGGFGVIHCLHLSAPEKTFATARAAASMTFVGDGAAAWPQIEHDLSSVDEVTASVFINDNPGSPFARMHSVCVALDSNGPYAYDSNPPGGIVSLPHGKSQLGLLGNVFVFRKK